MGASKDQCTEHPATFGSFLKLNKDTEVTVNGQKTNPATATYPHNSAAVTTAPTQRFIKETGLSGYRGDLLAIW